MTLPYIGLALVILNMDFYGSPLSLQTNAKIGPQIKPCPLLSTSFLILYSLLILPLVAYIYVTVMLQILLLIYNVRTGSRADSFNLHSDSWFESCPGHWLYRKGFDGFLLSLQEHQIGPWLYSHFFSLILEFNIIYIVKRCHGRTVQLQ